MDPGSLGSLRNKAIGKPRWLVLDATAIQQGVTMPRGFCRFKLRPTTEISRLSASSKWEGTSEHACGPSKAAVLELFDAFRWRF